MQNRNVKSVPVIELKIRMRDTQQEVVGRLLIQHFIQRKVHHSSSSLAPNVLDIKSKADH